jgi:phage terminase small subunit
MKAKISPPAHLTKEARRLWKALLAEWPTVGDVAGLAILKTGLEAFDRATGARLAIDKDGLTIVDRFGIAKPHPLLPAERDARGQWLAALKQLNLDVEPLRDKPGRPGGR